MDKLAEESPPKEATLLQLAELWMGLGRRKFPSLTHLPTAPKAYSKVQP